jgi:recombination protein RecT
MATNNRGGGALAKRESAMTTVRDMFGKMEDQLKAALPKHLEAGRMIRVMLTEVQRNPKLLECEPKSLCGALMEAAQLGLEPTGALGQAWIIPYGNTATFQPGYKGLRDLAYRSGMVTGISDGVVRESDTFRISHGLHRDLVHEYDHRLTPDERGDVIGVYVVAHMKDSEPMFKWMSKTEVDAHKARFSKAWNKPDSPWNRDWEAMALKTCFIQLFRWLPCSVEVAKAVAYDIEMERGIDMGVRVPVKDVTPPDEPENIPTDGITDPKQAEIAAKLAGKAPETNEEAPQDTRKAEPVSELTDAERAAMGDEIRSLRAKLDADSVDSLYERWNPEDAPLDTLKDETLTGMLEEARRLASVEV